METCLSETAWQLHRPAVFGVAYRLLGSVSEAEDVTHEVWLRAAVADLSAVRDLRAWLVTVAARVSYNILQSARVRRESYVGPWLPEPLLTGPDTTERVLVDESVSTAMLVVMQELDPAERVAFVLHDVFEIPFNQIAQVLDRSPAASRQLASRARRQVASAEKHPTASRAEQERVLVAFRAACEEGNLEELVRLLDPDAVYVADGAGKVGVARHPVHSAERIANLFVRVSQRELYRLADPIELNGQLALATYQGDQLVWVDTIEIANARVTQIWRVVNPEKLTHLGHI